MEDGRSALVGRPHARGLLDVGGGNTVYWEACGNPDGKAAVVLHGGPGSGCSAWFRRLFDPSVYRTILFDQRNCGRSRPHAGEASIDLAENTTEHLVADLEHLRVRLGIDRWLVLGGSWGSTLALAYTVRHPARVDGLVLFGVTTGRRAEFDWTFRGGLATFCPEQWERLRAELPERRDGDDVVACYHRLLMDRDPAVRRRAATSWCLWESSTHGGSRPRLEPRFEDEAYALAFARLVTHYVSHNAWLGDDGVLPDAANLAGIAGIAINGRGDLQAPVENARMLQRVWPACELVVVESGHRPSLALEAELRRATAAFARMT